MPDRGPDQCFDGARLSQSAELMCPPFSQAAGLDSFEAHLKMLNWGRMRPLEAIGLELRVAFAAIGSQDNEAADNSFWRRKCRELMLRPAIEPLLFAHWSKLRSFEMTEAQVERFSSLLLGSPQRARPTDSFGLWDGGDVRFEPTELARSWWNDIQTAASQPELKALLPAYCFARTIIAHPYADGNGRLARALVHAALARTLDYTAPAPLGPAFYMNGVKIAAALCDLSSSGDWARFNAAFSDVLRHAASLRGTVRFRKT